MLLMLCHPSVWKQWRGVALCYFPTKKATTVYIHARLQADVDPVTESKGFNVPVCVTRLTGTQGEIFCVFLVKYSFDIGSFWPSIKLELSPFPFSRGKKNPIQFRETED